MAAQSKDEQLQIRVSRAEKSAILRAARRAGMDMSSYVLSRVLSRPAALFQEHIAAAALGEPSYGLAELNTLLTELPATDLRDAVAVEPATRLTPFLANYVAAMVELACARKDIPIPSWTRAVIALEEPWFASPVLALRHYLLTHSPAPFQRRNIFIDSTLGARV
jgi:uncharacterized protein (DUF1778 family)